ncbi:hypothetical protein [Kitasatospora sp. NPDC051914]|uniref:hypothetical protein n=1 Tax=Kitasatospora sp. NPDC051914 TaxID=3154945 RepID=UPI0034203CC6
MPQLVQLAMPDGQVIWASVEGPGGPRDTGLGDRLAEKVEGFQEALRAVAGNVRDAMEARTAPGCAPSSSLGSSTAGSGCLRGRTGRSARGTRWSSHAA